MSYINNFIARYVKLVCLIPKKTQNKKTAYMFITLANMWERRKTVESLSIRKARGP